MRISVVGLGYVGSVTAACLADAGHHVIGVDIDPTKTSAVNSGDSPVVEPGLDEMMARAVASGRLRATSNLEMAVDATELALLCVGTPSQGSGGPDLGTLENVCREIGRCLQRPKPYTVVVRSTVLPGTTETLLRPALQDAMGGSNGHAVTLAVNPEFMREGSALQDFAKPPLILAGCDDEGAAALLRQVYDGVDAEFVQTGIRTAEMAKYAANAFHALKVCFANEIGNLSQTLGADPQEVMQVFCKDRVLNVSPAYLRPGFAFGGSCLPKDVRALLYAARRADLPVPLLSRILPSNELQIRRGIEQVIAAGRRRIGIAGLAFKAETDDLRESPMVTLVETLIGKGFDVRVFDRNVQMARLVGANRRYIEETIPHITSLMCTNDRELLDHADVLVVTGADDDQRRILAAVRPGCIVIDLSQGGLGRQPLTAAEPAKVGREPPLRSTWAG